MASEEVKAIKDAVDKHVIGQIPPASEHWRYGGELAGRVRLKVQQHDKLWNNQEAGDEK